MKKERQEIRKVREILVTVDDFVNSFNHIETSMLSHLELPEDPLTRQSVIETHLDNALIELASWYYMPYDALPEIVRINCKPCLIAIARKSLEFSNPREVTVNDYSRCKEIADTYLDLIKLKAQMAKLKDLPVAGPIGDIEDDNLAAFSI